MRASTMPGLTYRLARVCRVRGPVVYGLRDVSDKLYNSTRSIISSLSEYAYRGTPGIVLRDAQVMYSVVQLNSDILNLLCL